MKQFVVLLLGTIMASSSFASPKVIYGEDDRKDVYEVTNPMALQLAESTVVLINKSSLSQNSSGMMNIRAGSLQSRMNVCSNEPYFDQPSGGFCSGTLIGKKTLLTAGHCIRSETACADTQFVFGYHVSKKGEYPRAVPEQNVVGCKRIIKRDEVSTGADYAIVELTREITHRPAARLALQRRTVEIENGTKLLMIGHPSGLPTKIEDGGKVRDASKNNYFIATTDSYGGNSGSGVFNLTTGELEGVLVRGETDFVIRNGCYVSNVCSENGCRGEDVTKVSAILPFVPARL